MNSTENTQAADRVEELIRQLLPLMPGGRFRIERRDNIWGPTTETLSVIYGGGEHRVGWLMPRQYRELGPFSMIHIEAALREELVQRGWPFDIGYNANDGTYTAAVGRQWGTDSDHPLTALLSAFHKTLELTG